MAGKGPGVVDSQVHLWRRGSPTLTTVAGRFVPASKTYAPGPPHSKPLSEEGEEWNLVATARHLRQLRPLSERLHAGMWGEGAR